MKQIRCPKCNRKAGDYKGKEILIEIVCSKCGDKYSYQDRLSSGLVKKC